ncbi:synaptobrevin-domain-containing protein [Phellopilus nigrolimitatus]|nr:synaptobrevin-domain-containing protein [Phellopilus nigrolimitatus]
MDNNRYDPYVPRSGGSGGNEPTRGDPKISRLHQEVEGAQKIMNENIQSVVERGDTLANLQDKTDDLAVSAQNFRRGANKVRKNMWWKDMKMRIIIAVAVAIILVIIIVPIVKTTGNKN